MNISITRTSFYTLAIAAAMALFFFLGGAVAHAAGTGTVTLTFDDGNPSQYKTPAQMLKAVGQNATFYINSGFLGRRQTFWADPTF